SAPDAAPPGAAVVRRVRGAVEGQIVPERFVYAVGEPILVRMELRNTGTAALRFAFGGDWFGRLVPMRYAWRVWDERGALLCDLGRPVAGGSAGGGGGGTVELAPGGTHRETHLLNDACDALARPGRYRLEVVRVLSRPDALRRTRDGGVVEQWCHDLTPPDLTALPAGSPDPHGRRSVACMDALRQFPVVVTEFPLEITPWDARRLRATFGALPAEREAAARADDPSREGSLGAFGQWFCARIRCDCPDDVRDQRVDDWFARALSRVPERFTGPCPER
ncbi:MAG: hypothetical protein JWM10_3447, partial [Myxococcaceae bacterium]|nr:hypothetical protein [Myxococcaceae bacterium]